MLFVTIYFGNVPFRRIVQRLLFRFKLTHWRKKKGCLIHRIITTDVNLVEDLIESKNKTNRSTSRLDVSV